MLHTLSPLGRRVRKHPTDALYVEELSHVTNLYLATFPVNGEAHAVAVSMSELAGLGQLLIELHVDTNDFIVWHAVKDSDVRYELLANNGYQLEDVDVPGYVTSQLDSDIIHEQLDIALAPFQHETMFGQIQEALPYALQFIESAVVGHVYLHTLHDGVLVSTTGYKDPYTTHRLTFDRGEPVLEQTFTQKP